MSFHWPRSVPVMLASGVWQHLADRLGALGDDETTNVAVASWTSCCSKSGVKWPGHHGAKHYQTLWSGSEDDFRH